MSDTKDTILLGQILSELREVKEVVKDAFPKREAKKVDVQEQAGTGEEVE